MPRSWSPPTQALVAASFAGAAVFAGVGWRHLSLYQVGRQWPSAAAGAAFLAMAATGPAFLVAAPSRAVTAVLVLVDIGWSFAAIAATGMRRWRLQDLPWHNERPDGTGYPDGLTADQIPLGVAIVSVCDAYDAMTRDRHYRSALTAERALAILDDNAGTQFDPTAVRLLHEELAQQPVRPLVFSSLGETSDPRRSGTRLGGGPEADDAARISCAHALRGGSGPPPGR